MQKLRMTGLPLALIVLVVALASARDPSAKPPPSKDWTPAQFEAFIRDAETVEFVFNKGYANPEGKKQEPVENTVMVKPEDVKAFVSLVKVVEHVPCGCDHVRMIIFRRGTQRVDALICDHCFDLYVDGKFAKACDMPAAVYDAFSKSETEYRKRR